MTAFLLMNIYNAINELDQVKTLTDLADILDCVGDIRNKKKKILCGEFNVILDSFLEVQGGKPILKKHT